MQYACAILLSVACLTVNYFPRYLLNGRIFHKKVIVHVLFFSLQLLSEAFFIVRRTEREVMIKYVQFYVKYLFFVRY